jgi:hypothetical protein
LPRLQWLQRLPFVLQRLQWWLPREQLLLELVLQPSSRLLP